MALWKVPVTSASLETSAATAISSALGPGVFWLDKLLVVRGGVPEGVIDPPAMPFRSIDKPVEIFFDVDRLQDQAFIPNGLGVFDQNSRGTVDAPHPESCPQKSAVRIKFFQVCHRVETIDRNSVLSGKAVIGLVTDSSSIEQLLPFHAKLKSFFLNLVPSPHADGVLKKHRQFQGLGQLEAFPGNDRTRVQIWIDPAAKAVEDAQILVLVKIGRHPAYGKRLKIPVPVFSSPKSGREMGLLVVGKHAYHRNE